MGNSLLAVRDINHKYIVVAVNFFMPHQSFVVNLKYVKDIKNYELLMTNGIRIPLSQKRAVLFKKIYIIYIKFGQSLLISYETRNIKGIIIL